MVPLAAIDGNRMVNQFWPDSKSQTSASRILRNLNWQQRDYGTRSQMTKNKIKYVVCYLLSF